MGEPITDLVSRRQFRVAGLMSGTSADGVDVAIVDLNDQGARLVAFGTVAYPPEVRARVFDLFLPETARLDEICQMNFLLGELFADALTSVARESGVPVESIDLVGSHGQTICHLPHGVPGCGPATPSTLQIAEPCVIAERTGITTVADFRPRDIAAGGEGAPLVPYADFVLFRHADKGRAVQNIGGIANVTWLPAACAVEQIIAFDTGPGNMIIDYLAAQLSGGCQTYDRDGEMARRGRASEDLLAELMAHPFLARRPPKSTGREEFGKVFSEDLIRRARDLGLSDADLVATATAFTVRSIADAYRRFLPARADEVVLSGGGARNPAIREGLTAALAPSKVLLTDDLGIDADAREGASFAVLACETIRGIASNVPSATGARRPVVLGKIVPGNRP